MAAETVASALLGVIFEKLTDEALKKYARSQNIHSELKELKTTLSHIQALLHDASDKQVTEKSVQLWLNDLQHLAYDIDDVLDDVATDATHRELSQEPGAITTKVRNLIIPPCCTKFSLTHRLSSKIDSINTQLQQLENQQSALGLIKKDEKQKSTSRREETCLPDGSTVVGRKVEIEKLLNKLLSDESSKENFSIVPIVGMGGVGKTTLARLLYNDTQVNDHFEICVWICVCDDFDIFKISKIMFQDVSREDKKFENLNQLQVDLTNQLMNKRFLLVLDDVWHENDDDWENLVRPFRSCAPGSRIIMTTRKEELLKKLGFYHLDRVESLAHEDALSLFALHALGVENFDSHTTLKPHGEGIVKKCAGLPLALKAIGGLLRTRTNREDWEDVLNSELWNLKNSDKIVPALRLSYHDLSADLKQLFAYCSLFPKDFLFNKEELVLLWMAEGFLNPSHATKSPERLGHEYFDIMLSRSFFQYAPNDKSLFMMHDLMNDLATFVAGEFFLRFDNHTMIGMEALAKHRHMSFIREEYVGYRKFEAFKSATRLRTLLGVFVGVANRNDRFYLSNKILVDLLPKLPLLRVLSLSQFEISEVPEIIGSLKHLRYLNLAQTKIKELPENVGNLYNLQTLIVFGCEELIKLPKSFLKLTKLRHFDIRDTLLLEKLPVGIDELKRLYTLTKIIIGGEDDFALSKLKEFKNLHGIISIEGLQRVQSAMHAREVNLSLKKISKLELRWSDVFDTSRRGPLEMDVLNELEPNKDMLKVLSIVSYGGINFSNWVGDPSFQELVKVMIRGCGKCTSLPPFGQLPSLKELFIKGMDEVKVIGLETIGTTVVAFPSLKVILFEDMSGWEGWSTENEGFEAVFPRLRKIQINNCPNLINVSLEALPSLRVLKISRSGVSAFRSLVQAASSITTITIESISGLTDDVWRSVLKDFGTVEYLSIDGCDQIRYLWESEAEASKVLVKLERLKVSKCLNLVSLGEKEEDDNFGSSSLLSSLKMLYVICCNKMERCCCPNSISIEGLAISFCSSLTRVFFPTTTTQGGGQKLKSLDIFQCKKLMETFNNTSLPMLETMFIMSWINLKSIIQVSNSIHLTRLYIRNCPGIKSFPKLQLSNLTRLEISNCVSLESFPKLSNLNSLQCLEITKCPSIDPSFFHGIWPPKLRELETGGLKKPLSEWGDHSFPTSLVTLRLFHEPHVNNFGQLSHLLPSSLTELTIDAFDNLETLSMGLQNLTSLQHLNIWKCPKMKDLPEMLLPSLLSLKIDECPNLKERCNGKDSHYWPLISHIPCIRIDYRYQARAKIAKQFYQSLPK